MGCVAVEEATESLIESGVYLIIDNMGLLYAGSSGNVMGRLSGHDRLRGVVNWWANNVKAVFNLPRENFSPRQIRLFEQHVIDAIGGISSAGNSNVNRAISEAKERILRDTGNWFDICR